MIEIHIGGALETPGITGGITKSVSGVLVKDSMTAILINSVTSIAPRNYQGWT